MVMPVISCSTLSQWPKRLPGRLPGRALPRLDLVPTADRHPVRSRSDGDDLDIFAVGYFEIGYRDVPPGVVRVRDCPAGGSPTGTVLRTG